jgi:glycosyltransferase involved in cell wall biosynthesis
VDPADLIDLSDDRLTSPPPLIPRSRSDVEVKLPPRAAHRSCTAVSLVVPTRNERDNVGPLFERLREAFQDRRDWELLFVDDSDDDTPQRVAELIEAGMPVRLLHRAVGQRTGGLGGAVSAGFAAAHGEILIVLDADLQHPPALARVLADVANSSGADLVIASRYCPGGGSAGLDGTGRQLISTACRQLSRALLPPARGVRDPLGGFFALRRSVIEGRQLRPDGFKILLEILVKGDWSGVVEVPYSFAPRLNGESKARLAEGGRFLRHLVNLRRAHLAPGAIRP